MRLDKFLHDAGYGSRKELRKAVWRGRVEVEGNLAEDPAMQVNEASQVLFDGEPVHYQKYHTLLLHKPAGVISASKDRTHETVLDLIPDSFRQLSLAPVGRLDIDTTGLLLLTNDGPLNHRLSSPKYGVEKVYEFFYKGELAVDAEAQVAAGLDLGDFVSKGAKLERLGPEQARLTLQEGKFHQVKRMVHALGGEVSQLSRTAFGPIRLPEELAPGEWRYATESELQALDAASRKE